MSGEELVADTSALIYIAKADAFEQVDAIGISLAVVPSVWDEAVIQGLRAGYSDAARIEVGCRQGSLRLVELEPSLLERGATIASEDRLGRGGSQVIAFATAERHRALIDDRRALRAAQARGVLAFSTLALAVLARRAGVPVAQSLELLRDIAAAAGARADVLQLYERRVHEENR